MAATYNVPALVQVKAPQIKVQKDAYTNPQPLYNKAYEEYAKIGQQIANSAVGFDINREQYIKEEKEAQDKLVQDRLTNYSTDVLDVAGLTNTGNSKFDENKMNFFLDLKEQYIEIQNLMAENPEFAAKGSRELTKIKGMVDQFSSAAPKILQEIVWMRDKLKVKPGTQGAISSLFPDAMQRMLLAIGGDGDVDVSIVMDGDQLVLFAPDQTYMEDGKEIHMDATSINVNKFIQLGETAGGAIPTIGDWETEVLEATRASLGVIGGATPGNDSITGTILPKYIDTEIIKTKDGQEYENKTWAKEIVDKNGKPIIGPATLKTGLNMEEIPNPFAGQPLTGRMLAIQELITNGTFNSLLNNQDPNDNDMEIYWADVVGDPTDEFGDKLSGYDGIPGQNSAWDVTDPKKVALAVEWFANRGIEKYEHTLGMQAKPTAITPPGAGDGTQQEAVNLYNDLATASQSGEGARNYFMNKSIGGKRILDVTYMEDFESLSDFEKQTKGKSNIITLTVAVGKDDADEIEYDLNNPASLKTLIKDLVKDQYGSDNDAEKIRSQIYRMITASKKKKKDTKKVNTDYQ